MNDMKLQLWKQMRQKHLLVNLMGGDSTANTCQEALTSGDPMQGCPLSGRGFTAALVAIDKDVFWDPVFEWGGHLEDKSGASGLEDSSAHTFLRLSRWILKDATFVHAATRRMRLHVCRFSRESSTVFSAGSHCRWDGDGEVDTLISGQGVLGCCAPTGFACSPGVQAFLLKYKQELFF